MKYPLYLFLSFLAGSAAAADPAGPLYQDSLRPPLKAGWTWLHESPQGWKMDAEGLHLQTLPGTLWGSENDGRNELVRPAPGGDVAVEVTLHMDPPEPLRWEQAGLLWFFDDDRFVKLVKEIEHGKWNIVMGREWDARTTVLCVTPVADGPVRLRLEVRGTKVTGRYRVGDGEWLTAAECELPENTQPKIGLHAQRGPKDPAHWVRLHDLAVERIK